MATVYDRDFFSYVAADSLRNAQIVVPIVMEMLHPKSVLDIGCGPGAWLKVFKDNGAEVICGVDGDYVDRSTLLINGECFRATDLTQPFRLDREYDLVVCIEVAEHLPATQAENLIELLTAAAPVVLFSAAIPGQGGDNHINEQWPQYWRERFAERDWVMLDPIRPRIRDDPRVLGYLRQNLLLAASNAWLELHAGMKQYARDSAFFDEVWIHRSVYEPLWWETQGVKNLLSRLPSAIRRAIARRLKKTTVQ
jgi:SAM-dependent methyltransferase